MRGAVSKILSAESAAETAAAMADCGRVEIAGAGHSVQGDNPRDFAHELDRFVVSRLGAAR